jgi:polyhydroxybutyrate depolymerase
VRFLLALTDTVARMTGANAQRLLVVGTSNGGMMTLRLAIEAPTRLAAAAPIVASMPARSECRAPSAAVPILFTNGTEDPLLPYGGGEVAKRFGDRGSVIAVDSAIGIWRALAGLHGAPERETLRPRLAASADRSRFRRVTETTSIERLTWRAAGVPTVMHLRVVGGGHVEPSIRERYQGFYTRIVGPQNGDIELADEVWRFFAAVGAP